jgi:hypothetical protein
MNHTDELKEVLQNVQEEFSSQGEITVSHGSVGRISMFDGSYQMIFCSGIATEWEEGIYYNIEQDIFFFEGELRSSFGGNRTSFSIDGEMLTLLPEGLKEVLKRVAETEIPETISFEELPNLLPG